MISNRFSSVRNLFRVAVIAVVICAPLAATAATWQLVSEDNINDFWCPLTDANRAYGSTPDCPVNPLTTTCTGSGRCKIATIGGHGGSPESCLLSTDIYRCPGSDSPSCTLEQTSPGGCTQTGTEWVTTTNQTYAGTATHTWGPQTTSCRAACMASGTKFCDETVYRTNMLSNVSYSCSSYNSASVQNAPQQRTNTSSGEPDTSTTSYLMSLQPTYACTEPTYACTATPTATLTATPPSIASGESSTLHYSCGNSTSASINQGVGSVSGTSGDTAVSPTANTTYTLTCTNGTQSATDTATVTVTSPAITASCSVSPTSITTGGTATWSATASGGTGTYSYSWSGTDGLQGKSGTPVSVTYSTAGTKTGSVTVISGTQTKTVSCANSLTVTSSAQPDLTASDVSASNVNGLTATLTATITNGGAIATGAAFTDLFQRATSAAGANATDIGTYANSALATGGSNTATNSGYTFPSEGLWYVRACADKSSAGNGGVITESNESNNCSNNWTAITVCPSGQTWNGTACVNGSSVSCKVNGSSSAVNVAVGDTVTYTASGASTPYTWTTSDGGSYSGGTAATVTRTINANGSYGMTVSKNGFTSGNCPVVTVGTPSCGIASIGSFAADKTRVRPGESVHLTWSASGVDTSCVVTGPGVNRPKTPTSCSASDSFDTPGITTQSTYTLDCDDGEDTETVIVNVVPVFDEF